MKWIYLKKSEKQLKNWYSNKKYSKKVKIDFKDFMSFNKWYNDKEKICFYCGLSEEFSQKIIHNGLLKSNRFPLNGKITRGVNRGYWLEIDRKNPKGNYSFENCELCCYFCNNDKSDVFGEIQYKEFITDRIGFLNRLAKFH